jgi:hypothetical protein
LIVQNNGIGKGDKKTDAVYACHICNLNERQNTVLGISQTAQGNLSAEKERRYSGAPINRKGKEHRYAFFLCLADKIHEYAHVGGEIYHQNHKDYEADNRV